MGNLKTHKRKITFSALAAIWLSLVTPSSVAAASIDMRDATVVASESIEVQTTQQELRVYLQNFRANNEIWLNISLPVADTLIPRGFSPREFDSTGTLTRLSFLLPPSLALTATGSKFGELVTTDGMAKVSIYLTPPDFPSWSIEGVSNSLNSKELLLNPAVGAGSYAVAISNGRIVFFQKSSTFTLGFKRISISEGIDLPSGQARYAYMERVQLSKQFYTQGIWKLLDKTFEQIGTINKPVILGKPHITEGHDIAVSPSGNAVVMAYVDRKVDSSWLEKPFKSSNVLDCVFSEIKDGKAIKTFSFWNWVNSHRSQFKKILGSGDRAQDLLIPTQPVDFCHANSIDYSKDASGYVISLRSIDLVLQVDENLKTLQRMFYTPGARQHFAEYSSKNGYTALGNYTSSSSSKFQQWKRVGGKWKLTETPLPLLMQYCGNSQIVDYEFIWVAGGCANATKDTMGILFSRRQGQLVEVSRLKSIGTSGSYRVDIND